MTKSSGIERPAPRVPVRRNGVATKAKVVEAAIKLMGVDDHTLTMRSLSTEAGCSPAAVYQFFSDMDDVLSAVSEVMVEEAIAHLSARLTASLASTDPTRFFAEMITGIESLQCKRPATICVAKLTAAGPALALSSALRKAIFTLVSNSFCQAYPLVDSGQLNKVLAIAQGGVLGALAELPPRNHRDRPRYLALVSDLAGGFVARNLIPISSR